MEKLFESLFTDGIAFYEYFIVIAISIVLGFLISFVSKYKSKSSRMFYLANIILPMIVSIVIMFVNGNLGLGVAVAGAFSLVRFRSANGNAKEITIIFISMAIGLGLGTGYIAYTVIFTVIASLIIFIFERFDLFKEKDTNEKILKVTIPEVLDFDGAFNDILNTYTTNSVLLKTKTSNMGSLYILTYKISFKENVNEKSFLDELRTRNGNLEIQLSKVEDEVYAL